MYSTSSSLLLLYPSTRLSTRVLLPIVSLSHLTRPPLSTPTTHYTSYTETMTPKPPRQPLKLLMLHGYTQSGSLFHAKSRALIKHITKAFPLHEVAAIYPTGPLHLDPADIPGYGPSPEQKEKQGEEDSKVEAFGWWRRSNTADPPLYIGIEEGLGAVARVLREEGPFDGVIGFSQGAALAAMVASLLETGRKESFDQFVDAKVACEGVDLSESTEKEPIPGLVFPTSFIEDEAVRSHPPLKFAICYSGFRAPGPRYRAFYERPAIRTPVLHVLGSLDAVVDEGRSRSLIEACEGDAENDGKVVWHPGGHFLPSQRPFLDAAVSFIQERLGNKEAKGKEKEEDVHDMDLPF